MFQGFTQEASDFLWELAFHNERSWFKPRKEQFDRCLGLPFKELALETRDALARRTPGREWQLHISRIYRDARRLFGRGPYKDHLWFSLYRGDSFPGAPSFWFELNAAMYLYGAGAYDVTPGQMEAFRRSIVANPARFERLALDAEAQGPYLLTGEEYKRPKGDLGPALNRWYNRRGPGLERSVDFGGDLLTPRLPELLAEAFLGLMPMYDYLFEVFGAAYGAQRREEEHA